jgi:UTP--glucose-1-phosphate uridylyltransferase
MSRRVRKAVFPVAGLGTRFLPATKSIPKELLPVVDKPVIHYAVDEARAAGIEQFIFVSSRGKTAMEDHFDRSFELEDTLRKRGRDEDLTRLQDTLVNSGDLVFVRQQEPLGLGHAVWCARHIVGDEPFAVLLPDDIVMSDPPCIAELIDAHESLGRSHVIAVQDVPREHTNRYGILDLDAQVTPNIVRAKGIVEKPTAEAAPSTTAAIGRYVLDPAVFEHLDKRVQGAGNEIQLTDAIAATMDVAPLHGCHFKGDRYDCGDKLGFLKANIAFALQRPDLADGLRAFMRGLEHPE